MACREGAGCSLAGIHANHMGTSEGPRAPPPQRVRNSVGRPRPGASGDVVSCSRRPAAGGRHRYPPDPHQQGPEAAADTPAETAATGAGRCLTRGHSCPRAASALQAVQGLLLPEQPPCIPGESGPGVSVARLHLVAGRLQKLCLWGSHGWVSRVVTTCRPTIVGGEPKATPHWGWGDEVDRALHPHRSEPPDHSCQWNGEEPFWASGHSWKGHFRSLWGSSNF